MAYCDTQLHCQILQQIAGSTGIIYLLTLSKLQVRFAVLLTLRCHSTSLSVQSLHQLGAPQNS